LNSLCGNKFVEIAAISALSIYYLSALLCTRCRPIPTCHLRHSRSSPINKLHPKTSHPERSEESRAASVGPFSHPERRLPESKDLAAAIFAAVMVLPETGANHAAKKPREILRLRSQTHFAQDD
jgi:hypothetical protein